MIQTYLDSQNVLYNFCSSGGRSGIVFDDIAKKDVIKSAGKTKSTFGDRKIESKLTPPSKVMPSNRILSLPKKKDKENKTDNLKDEKQEPLKGFLLFFEENSQKISEDENILDSNELRENCLKRWQEMTKSEKEGYKTPRLPKRKREDDQNTPTTASKLAKFAVSK